MPTETASPQRYETLVVAKEQLTTENLRTLADGGWTIVSDPSLLVFARPAGAPAAANGHDAAGDAGVLALPGVADADAPPVRD